MAMAIGQTTGSFGEPECVYMELRKICMTGSTLNLLTEKSTNTWDKIIVRREVSYVQSVITKRRHTVSLTYIIRAQVQYTPNTVHTGYSLT